MFFLGLITRCKDEFFIKEFCDYYLSQGVDKIFVIDDNSNDKSIYNNIDDNRIEIIYEKNIIKNNYANKLYKQIKSNFKWMIYCDVDEFITTKKNIINTIKDELNTTFKDVDCIKIPWVMMSCNSIEKNPNSILSENTYRWNHNKKHPHKIRKFRCRYDEIEVKCIFKTDKFNSISDHHPKEKSGHIFIADSISKTERQSTTGFYNNLRENDIENGILLCYHYRIISKENSINKIKTNLWYIQNGYTNDDLMSCDYPEIIDETLKYKTHCNLIKNKLKIIQSNYFLGLITRCKDEYFIEEFCNYYFNQGVDKIFILDDKSNNNDIYNNIKNDPRIFIYYAKNNSKCHDHNCSKTCTCNRVLANEIYKNVNKNFKWMIYCDVDEFITTKKNENLTITDILKTTYKNVDCISIPWIMMSALNGPNPKSVLETNIYRINYDKKPNYNCNSIKEKIKFSLHSSGKQVQCKSIFKCNKFNGIHDIHNPSDHHPLFPNCKKINWKQSVDNSNVCLNYKNHTQLSEVCIKSATLLCYHYRVISKEHAITKLNTNDWYKENGYTLKHLMKTNNDIKDETLKYKSLNNKLKFVHITKTAGTYIEDIAFEKNILWGRHDNKLLYLINKYKRSGPGYGSPWHEPILFLNENPYRKNTKLFTIVRNPYDRIISECLCKYGGRFSEKMKTKEDLNFYINEQVKKKQVLDLSFHHFLPQNLYTHNESGKKIIDIIIKYEEINKFNDLMKQFNIDIEYVRKEKLKREFNIKDISETNIKLINNIYHLDFIYYNYQKL